MGKKKVAVLLPWLKMGGTNQVALRWIRQIRKLYDVTLILSQDTGELKKEVPEGITVLIDPMRDFKSILREDLQHVRPCSLFRDIRYYLRIKGKLDDMENYRYLVQRNDPISREVFDCAISYHGQSPERLLQLLYRISAKKKVAWIHGELQFPEKDCKKMEKYYQKVDHFFFVSEPTRKAFLRKIEVDEKKCTVYYNPLSKEEILQKARCAPRPEFDKNWSNLLTVGRISREKGQDMIPDITRNLLRRGYKIRWYIIGDGPQREELERQIEEKHVKPYVILLGVKENPYGYMKECDLYIQPSYTEGYSTTICEAAVLGKAIIGTKPSGGIYEQICDGWDGKIVDAAVEDLTEGIAELLEQEEKRKMFGQEIQKKDWEKKGELAKFVSYMES